MKISVFGHPYSSIGTGEQLASFSRALDTCYIEHSIIDIYGPDRIQNDKIRPWLIEKETDDLNCAEIRIFHINGDEIMPCLDLLEKRGFRFSAGEKNIIIPAWELPVFPEIWREPVSQFDEIWAISHYIERMFTDWAKPVVRYVGQSAQRENGVLYTRKYFGIKDSSLVFLSFFDQSSYDSRKNPMALIELYQELRKKHPYNDFQFVLKTKNIDSGRPTEIERIDENVIIINENLNYDETTSLIDSSDIFISLHRAEGFGRGAAEAVLRGRRAIITDYSGVQDYSADPAILPVGYDLVSVNKDEYPCHEGQVWAEPRIADAIKHASRLISEHERGQTIGHFFQETTMAGQHVRDITSHFGVGVNIVRNLKDIDCL